MGFGLIDQRTGRKRPLWYELKAFNEWVLEYSEAERCKRGEEPGQEELRKAAIEWLKKRAAVM